jgi:threonylcarbamoyladenosine tRNA methylthiotransferase MtaB
LAYRVGLATLGCKVSQYETEAIAEAFAERGFLLSDFDGPCEVYVVNTCTVTAESDRKSRQMIRRALRKNPSAVMLVTGCYSQLRPEEVAEIEGVSYVSGSDRKLRLVERAEQLLRGERVPLMEVSDLKGATFERMCIHRAPRTRAYVKIEDGCACRCTYCTIPAARGYVRSKAKEDVIREVRGLVEGGTREVVLTGIETAAYGMDLDAYRLPDLLADLSRETDVERIRLGSLSPEMMTPATVERLARIPKLAPHFHLSMQSGSDAVLRAMRRRYLSEHALTALRMLREAMPRVQFTTDMMVGFPGETEALFAETEAFCREARFLQMHVFAYSRRPGTLAAELEDQVDEGEKRRRSAALIALDREIRGEILSGICKAGEPLSVLFETESEGGLWHGHSDEFIEVAAESETPLAGRLASVLPLSFSDGIIRAKLLSVHD